MVAFLKILPKEQNILETIGCLTSIILDRLQPCGFDLTEKKIWMTGNLEEFIMGTCWPAEDVTSNWNAEYHEASQVTATTDGLTQRASEKGTSFLPGQNQVKAFGGFQMSHFRASWRHFTQTNPDPKFKASSLKSRVKGHNSSQVSGYDRSIGVK